MQNSQPSRSVDRDLINDLEVLTRQLPDGSSFNRRLRCLMTEYRALRSVLSAVNNAAAAQLTTFPYPNSDVFPNAVTVTDQKSDQYLFF